MEGGAKKGSTWRWRWVFGGGKPPHLEDAAEGTSDHVLLTGHSDGRVRVWDLATEVPGLLATVPFDSGGAGTRLRAVTAIQVSSSVELFQFSCVTVGASCFPPLWLTWHLLSRLRH